MILSLSNKTKYFKKYKKVVTIENIFSTKKHSRVKIVKNIAKSKNQVNKTYSYCEKIYKKLLNEISIQLNILHGTNNSKRYWEIIIGDWLKDIVLVCHKNFFNCKNVINKIKFSNYIAVRDNDYSLHTRNTIEGAYATFDSDWNFALNSKIFRFLNINVRPIYKKINKNFFKLEYSVNQNSKTDLFNFLNPINKFSQNNKIFIYKTSLPFITEKKLEMKLGQLPTFWKYVEPKYSQISVELRKNFNLINKKKQKLDQFEMFIRKIIPSTFPVFALETFKVNLKISENLGYPKNPQKIFTCLATQGDELFKIYLAEQIKKKSKYYCGQHGNNYFTSHLTRISVDVKTPDRFLSWGFKDDKKKITPVSNFKCIGKLKTKRCFKKSGNLLVICNIPGHNRSPIERNDLDEKQINSTFLILKNLRSDIKHGANIRISQNYKDQFNGYYFKKYFLKSHHKVSFLEKNNLRLLQSNSRLSFFNYYSTGMLENFLLNIPCVSYLDMDLECYNNLFFKKIKYLVEAKIVFFDKHKLVSHINQIWNNVDFWWTSAKTQKLISKFNSNFNYGENNLENLIKIIKHNEI